MTIEGRENVLQRPSVTRSGRRHNKLHNWLSLPIQSDGFDIRKGPSICLARIQVVGHVEPRLQKMLESTDPQWDGLCLGIWTYSLITNQRFQGGVGAAILFVLFTTRSLHAPAQVWGPNQFPFSLVPFLCSLLFDIRDSCWRRLSQIQLRISMNDKIKKVAAVVESVALALCKYYACSRLWE